MANDPRVFLAGVVELFCAYPEDIVVKAVSVVHGLPSKYKFAPRIAEIKEFLEDLMGPRRREEYRQRLAEERAHTLPPPVDRSQRLSYDELQAKYGEDWGLAAPPRRAPPKYPSIDELKSICGEDQWNKIPDAK